MCVYNYLFRYAIDKGYVSNPASPETVVNIQCPCGLVKAFVSYNNGKTGAVRFHSVPAFVLSTGEIYFSLLLSLLSGSCMLRWTFTFVIKNKLQNIN